MPFGDRTTKGRKFPVEILTPDEVRSLLDATSKRGRCGVRDRALLAVLYRGGLRIAEALALQPKDIDLSTGVVQVLQGKGRKRRVVAIDDEAVQLVATWLEVRAEIGATNRRPLFCTLEGKPMSDTQVRQHLKALAERAGIEKRVHPHGLRHSLAAGMVDDGVDIRIVQQALGHTSLTTTQTYVNHIRPQQVIEAMKRRAW